MYAFREKYSLKISSFSFLAMFSPTLLITDDDAGFRETLREILELEGFRTFSAEDGMEAFEIVKAEPVHAVLLDMHMPRINGLETIRLVHEIKPELPCILLSAALDEMIVKAAEKLFAFSVLSKPCSRKQIMSVVRRALQNSYSF
ncbi:MAG: response regulator [Planctomycetaceae bacterium]|jgi:DNA-binding NtrC family response regulator|nr:response regulator [Planctomycetaceae bacterium]